MFKFFDFLFNLISTIWSFFETAFEFVLDIIMFIINGAQFMAYNLVFLPPFAVGFVSCVLGIAVASLIVGHLLDL